MITELLIGAGALWLINRNRKPKVEHAITGIGAVKRRIYKELSLAQQAGVDFTKPFDELSADEIEALERVSHDTGYTETYYKSLQKAYNAISGIGEAYDVVNEDGETVLTWIENPDGTQTPVYRAADDAERYAALREAHDIEEDRIWAENNRAQAFEEREARLAEQRKRLRKAGRTSQMSLFGIGDLTTWNKRHLANFFERNMWNDRVLVYIKNRDDRGNIPVEFIYGGHRYVGSACVISPNNIEYLKDLCRIYNCEYIEMVRDVYYYPNIHAISGCGVISAEDALEPELLEYVRQRVDDRRMSIAYDQIDEMRCPLSMAEPTLYNNIMDLVEEWCLDNAVDPDSIWELFDAEDIFWAL